MSSTSCELCLKIIESQSTTKSNGKNGVTSHMWNYLFHKNIREGISIPDKCGLEHPTLTFTFTTGEGGESSKVIGNGDDAVEFCNECRVHLERLNNLQEELEEAKKQVRVQVRKMNNIRLLSRLRNANEQEENVPMESFRRKGTTPGMSLSGSTIGKENISQALTFLTNLCNVMGSSTASVPSPANQSSSKEIGSPDVRDLTAPSPLILQEIPKDELVTPDEMLQFEEDDIFISPGIKIEENERDSRTEQSDPLDSSPYILRSDTLEMETPHDDSQHSSDLTFSFTPGTVSNHDDPLRLDNVDPKIMPGSSQPPQRKRVRKGSKSFPSFVPCPDCGKLISYQNRHVHKRVHTGVKPFKCRVCEIAFSQWINLKRHYNTHKGVLPYKCENCEESFKTSALLKDHEKSGHENK